MKIPYICLLSLIISVDSYAMQEVNDEEIEMSDSHSSVAMGASSINGEDGAITSEQDLSESPLILAPAYASATDACWNKAIDNSLVKQAILLQNTTATNSELELLNSERKRIKDGIDNYSKGLKKSGLYGRNDGCYFSPSDKRIAHMKGMQQKGIVINDSLNAAGNFALLGEQIIIKKQVITDSETYIKSLDPNFLSPGSQTAIAKFQKDHNDLHNTEKNLRNAEGDWSETMFFLNPMRYVWIAEYFRPAHTNEIEQQKKQGIPLRHRLHPTANLVREEKIIDKADTVLWDAFCVEGHLKMDEIAAENAALRAQLATLQQQQNGAGTVPTQSQSVEELESSVEELGTYKSANFIGVVYRSSLSTNDSSSTSSESIDEEASPNL